MRYTRGAFQTPEGYKKTRVLHIHLSFPESKLEFPLNSSSFPLLVNNQQLLLISSNSNSNMTTTQEEATTMPVVDSIETNKRKADEEIQQEYVL